MYSERRATCVLKSLTPPFSQSQRIAAPCLLLASGKRSTLNGWVKPCRCRKATMEKRADSERPNCESGSFMPIADCGQDTRLHTGYTVPAQVHHYADQQTEEETKTNIMFSLRQKREIADAVQKILRATNHPELPQGEIQFSLFVRGAENWSWADICNNGAVPNPGVNPWNESQDPASNQIGTEERT